LSSLIEFRNVSREYILGEEIVHAIQHINIKIEQGELVAIVGPSGAGKSTLMDIIGLLDRPTSGEYLFNGKDVSAFSDDTRSDMRNHDIGFAFQSFFLLPHLTAGENVALPLSYRKMSKREIKKRCIAILETVGLGDRINHKPAELSGGQQQRVCIARALVTEPKIILADEPTGALDSASSTIVMDLLRKLNKEKNVTTIIITHNEDIARECPRIIHIRDGQVVP
jgi:putative ABC transport system ATP-binding protein